MSSGEQRTQFCYVCKRHYPYGTKEEQDRFAAYGHDRRKVSQLRRDPGRA